MDSPSSPTKDGEEQLQAGRSSDANRSHSREAIILSDETPEDYRDVSRPVANGKGGIVIFLVVAGALCFLGLQLNEFLKTPKDPVRPNATATVPTPSTIPVNQESNSSPPLPRAESPVTLRFAGKYAGDEFVNGIGMKFGWCPPGNFMMGSPSSEIGRTRDVNPEPGRTQKEDLVAVEITQGFWIGRFEVTQGEYREVKGESPSTFGGNDRLPVEMVNWLEAVKFCRELTDSERQAGRLPEGWVYRLPSEAEWEYACRAGTSSALNSGENLTDALSQCANLDEVGWHGMNSGGRTHEGGGKRANGWGFYDMHGNVWEWCADFYAEKLEGGKDPSGPRTGSIGLIRGGSWGNQPRDCRSAKRFSIKRELRINTIGFRVVAGPTADF